MDSMTICTCLRFNPNCFGTFAVFSYSTKSHVIEFQLRANLVKGKLVQLALLVHGIEGPYKEVFNHDNSWHSVCVSWSRNDGRWALFVRALEIFSGVGLNSSDSIGPDGLFNIGPAQNPVGGSLKKDESFSWSITELHIWNRVLSSSEIYTMEKACSPISSGLVLEWSQAVMEMKSPVSRLSKKSPCQGTFVRL